MNPFLSNVPLHPKRDVAILAREDTIADICKRVLAGECCLILGPKYSGRTTLLRAVKTRLQEEPGVLTVLVQPDEIDLTGDRGFLHSLAFLLQQVLQGEKAWPASLALSGYKIHEHADAFNNFLDHLLQLLDRRVILFFDSIELIPPHLLVRIANIAHSIFVTKQDKPFHEHISFNFAGAISLRYLTFSLKPEVSPFNICSSVPLRDLAAIDARGFLEGIVDKFDLPFRADGLSTILEYAGGDLNMLQRIAWLSLDASGPSGRVDKSTVEKVTGAIVQSDSWHTEESLRHTAHLVEEDLQVFNLVLSLLHHKLGAYQPSVVDGTLYGAFDITYPEMTGAVVLERPDGIPANWVFRNRLTELFLRHHFTPNRIAKTYLELGEFDAAVQSCDPLLDDLRKEFTSEAMHFNESGLKEILMVFISRIHAGSSHEFGYELLARLLDRGFGFSTVTYYEYIGPKYKLMAVPFLSALFENDGSEYDVTSGEDDDALEVQAYHSRLFKTEADQNQLKIAIPLKNFAGAVTAVVTVYTRSKRSRSANLESRVGVLERALQAINLALTKVESDHKNEMIRSLRSLETKDKTAKVFVAHDFSQELLNNLRDYLGKVSEQLEFRYVDKDNPVGFLSETIVSEMKSCRLCLYETSTPNNNVYFECGLGLGLNLPGLQFMRVKKGTRKLPRIPPVLDGLHYFNYFNYTSIVEDIAGRLKLALDSYWDNQRDPFFIHFLGIKLPELSKRIKYVGVLDHDHFGDQPDYRSVIEEAFREIGLETAYPLDEHVAVGRYLNEASQENMPRLMNVMSLLRNAEMIVSRVENVRSSRDSHISGQVFIGLGYAFGINEMLKKKRLKIHMTLLNQDHKGKRLDAPADLRGYPFLRYSSLPELKNLLTKVLMAAK